MSETRLGAIESIQHKLSVLCIGASEDVRAELADLIEDVGNLERNTQSTGRAPGDQA